MVLGIPWVCGEGACTACSLWSCKDEESSLQELSEKLRYNHKTWAGAGLVPVVRYLRGGKSLAIPEEWRGCLEPFV